MSDLVTAELVSDAEISLDTSELKNELSNIYYHLNMSYDNVQDHEVVHEVTFIGGGKTYYLPYDLTRLAKRLVKACS
ncbi:CO/xanthine dehydrogenase FAD-binding subunit [Ensifer sp. KUDG1]